MISKSNNISSILFQYEESPKTAIIYNEQKYSFQDIVNDTLKASSFLMKKGIKKGDKVLVFIPMSKDLYVTLLAIWQIGASAVFLDAWAVKNKLDYAAELTSCSAFIGIAKAHLLRFNSKIIRSLKTKIIARNNYYKKSIPIDKSDLAEVNLSDTALITFTTGSTGLPKAANRTHSYLLAQHKVINKHLNPDPDDIDLVSLPIFVLSNLASGICSYIPNINHKKPADFDPQKMISDIKKHSITTMAGSPVIFLKLAKSIIDLKEKIQLKRISLGGAPVFKKDAQLLKQAFPNTFIDIVYGSTEAEPISSVNANNLINNTNNEGLFIGEIIKEINLLIIDDINSGEEIKTSEELNSIVKNEGEAGEICVSGDHVLKEYYNCEEAQKINKFTIDNVTWHRTGDAAFVEGNYLYLLGRQKHKFIYENITYYLFPLEEKIKSLDGIINGTFLLINNDLHLILEGNELDKNELTSFIKLNNLPNPKIVKYLKIPRDPRHNSKIDYDLLKKIV